MKNYQILIAAAAILGAIYGADKLYHKGLEKGITLGTERGTWEGRSQMKEEVLYQLEKRLDYRRRDIEAYSSDLKFEDLLTKAEERLWELKDLRLEINFIPHRR